MLMGDVEGGRMVRLGRGSNTLVRWAPETSGPPPAAAAAVAGGSGSKYG